uniref:Photosystem II Psb31 protein domain-containing protein n=1 Tax=Corethron hystrix TaxID=216773 RepID=A0A7S1BC26_9STRA
MKVFIALSLAAASSAAAFVIPNEVGWTKKTSLHAQIDRRAFAAAAGLSFAGAAAPALAIGSYGREADYVPKPEDYKQIYFLGTTLDSLATKVADPAQFEAARKGVVEFNKEPSFYPDYARRFISKSVQKNAGADERVGYVREACAKIGSIQELLEGRQGLEGEAASAEAVKRVRDSQRLIAKFFAESGIEGEEKVTAYIRAHP